MDSCAFLRGRCHWLLFHSFFFVFFPVLSLLLFVLFSFPKCETNKSIRSPVFFSLLFIHQQLVHLLSLATKMHKMSLTPVCAMAFRCVCSLLLSWTEGLSAGSRRSPADRRRVCQEDQWIIQNLQLKIHTPSLTSWFGVDTQSKWSNIQLHIFNAAQELISCVVFGCLWLQSRRRELAKNEGSIRKPWQQEPAVFKTFSVSTSGVCVVKQKATADTYTLSKSLSIQEHRLHAALLTCLMGVL